MKLRKRGYVGTTSDEISAREIENGRLARRAASEGFVLLKNEGRALPVPKGTRIGLYGAGAVKTIKGGTGSGDVNNRASVSIYEGLLQAGYEVTSKAWLDAYERIYDDQRLEWKEKILQETEEKYDGNFFYGYSANPFAVPCGPMIDEAAAAQDGAEIAFFVLARIAGENADRHDEPGDYYITKEEHSLIAQVCRSYEKVVLVINTGGLMDLAFVEEFKNIVSIVQFVQAGQEGGTAFADVVCGDVTPSGKMTDTWALDYNDYPNASYFSYKSGNLYKEEYKENIFVGYRYFDTFDVPVRYSFGYGLSYTQFSIRPGDLTVDRTVKKHPMASMEVTVRNTGNDFSGKEVVQLYVSCPQGTLPKEYRRLAAFAKTALLAPGQEQQLTLTFDFYHLASYCESCAAWILEAGKYGIWVGNSLQSATLAATFTLDDTVKLVQCDHICERKEDLEELMSDPKLARAKEEAWIKEAAERNLPEVQLYADDFETENIVYSDGKEVFEGRAGEIVESLSTDQLIALATGDPVKDQSALGSAAQTVPGAAAETVTVAEADPWNVASIVLADGPAGLRLKKKYGVRADGTIDSGTFLGNFENGFFEDGYEPEGTLYYQYCTAIPVGTLLAQTWDVELVKEVGKMVACEMKEFEVSLWLAPGMSIHRNPLCGRNFEYFSEDPLLSGRMAAAMTHGVQSIPGCGTTIKHFCCNNQEDNRMGSDSVLSERTLREIYLKGFEIAVKEAQPMSIMTSYNLVNGVHAANCYDICTKAARDEWGFAGAIMTDWTTTTDSTAGEISAAGCMRAGNDMVMPGDLRDHESIRSELQAGTLSLDELKRCIYHTIRIILQTNQYE